MIETTRLNLFPASREQMETFIALQPLDVLKAAYTEMLEGALSHPEAWAWYAVWMIERKDGTHAGELCFKGINDDGSTEIGYGIAEEQQGQGYATEAVSAAVAWALEQTGINSVTAEAEEENAASRRVLEKVGFVSTGEMGEEGPIYKKIKNGSLTETGDAETTENGMLTKNGERITIRPETHADYKAIISLVLRSFREGTDYSDGTDIVALIEEIRDSEFYIPELSFVAELNGEIVGHFLFSRFPLSETPEGGRGGAKDTEIVMLAPVSVHADHLRQGVGSTMLRLGIERVKELGCKGITVEGNFHFYNTVGFRTSSEFGIYPTEGYPMTEPRCQMCMETYPGSLQGLGGYVIYDMYYNA